MTPDMGYVLAVFLLLVTTWMESGIERTVIPRLSGAAIEQNGYRRFLSEGIPVVAVFT